MLGLARCEVLASRFEDLDASFTADVVTVRAVRLDPALAALLARLVPAGGRVLSFGTPVDDGRFRQAESVPLPDGSTLYVALRNDQRAD